MDLRQLKKYLEFNTKSQLLEPCKLKPFALNLENRNYKLYIIKLQARMQACKLIYCIFLLFIYL